MSIMSSFSAHYGRWNLVVVLVGVVSWILYRYVVPQGWRKWTGTGLMQAFVIALYTEMYDFPLTICLLTGFFGIDIPLTAYSRHLWATLLGYDTAGAMVEMVIVTVFIPPGLTLLIWGWSTVYQACRVGRIAQKRSYGFVHHPRYLDIMLAVFRRLVHQPTLITVVLLPVVVFVYVRLAHKEEQDIVSRLGATYGAYQRRVPMLVPGRNQWKQLFSTHVGSRFLALQPRLPWSHLDDQGEGYAYRMDHRHHSH